MSEIVRANNAQIKINRPDGSTVEYSGPAEELSVILSQLEKTSKPWLTVEQLYRWATVFNRLQPLIWGIVAIFLVFLMLSWVIRPTQEYQPQSWRQHEQPS